MIHDVKLVAAREITEKARSRGFLVFTLLMAVLLPGAVVAMGVLGGRSAGQYEIAVTGKDASKLGQLVQRRADAFDATVTVRQLAGGEARRAVRGGDLDAAIMDSSRVLTDGGGAGDRLAALLRSSAQRLHALQTLRAAGVPDGQVREALSPPPLRIVSLGDDREAGISGPAVTAVGVVLLFLALMIYGSWVAGGVVEEKASRVVEVVVSTVRPLRLLVGKVLGIGVLALGQLAFSVALGLGVAVAIDVTLPAATFAAVGSVLLWFVLGFAFYCCIFAVAGSLVSKQEDLQYTQLPAMVPLMAGYFLAIQSQVGGMAPAVVHALAYVPFFSPMLMPVLTASGDVSGWEIGLAAVLMAAAAAVLMWAAARIYTGSVLRFGGRVSLREAWQ